MKKISYAGILLIAVLAVVWVFRPWETSLLHSEEGVNEQIASKPNASLRENGAQKSTATAQDVGLMGLQDSGSRSVASVERSLMNGGQVDAGRAMQLLGAKGFEKAMNTLSSERSDPAKAAEDQSLLDEALKASLKQHALGVESMKMACSGQLCMVAFDTAANEDAVSKWTESFSSTTNGLGSALFQDAIALQGGGKQIRMILSTNQNAAGGIVIPSNGAPVTIRSKPAGN